MTLDQYLRSNRIKGRQFAAKIDVHPSKITRLRRGQRQPSIALARKIEIATDGEVTAADFLSSAYEQHELAA